MITVPPPVRRRSRTAGRTVALVFGVLLLLPGIGLLAGGGVLLWAHWFDRSDGFVQSPAEDFGSYGYALVSDRIDLRAGPDWLPVSAALGDARLEVTGNGADDVFVGIAPVADATAYLEGVQRTAVDGLGFDGPATSSDQLPGGEPAGPPADQEFWIAQTSGPGTQQVTWDPAEGDWMFVVMNADGSAPVDVRARIGAEFPALGGIGWGVLAAGLVVTVLAAALIRPTVRRLPERSVDYATRRPVRSRPVEDELVDDRSR
ncbi:hypothetical protein [Geodermatophilus sp. URMC 64]